MRILVFKTSAWVRLQDFSPYGSTTDTDCYNLMLPICGLANEPIQLLESILVNLMEEPVDKYLEIRYNL